MGLCARVPVYVHKMDTLTDETVWFQAFASDCTDDCYYGPYETYVTCSDGCSDDYTKYRDCYMTCQDDVTPAKAMDADSVSSVDSASFQDVDSAKREILRLNMILSERHLPTFASTLAEATTGTQSLNLASSASLGMMLLVGAVAFFASYSAGKAGAREGASDNARHSGKKRALQQLS